MTLQQLKKEARKEFEKTYNKVFKEIKKPVTNLDEMLSGGVKTIYGYSKSYVEITEIKDFIDSFITKAYEEGKRDKLDEIPQMKGTREALDNLTLK